MPFRVLGNEAGNAIGDAIRAFQEQKRIATFEQRHGFTLSEANAMNQQPPEIEDMHRQDVDLWKAQSTEIAGEK